VAVTVTTTYELRAGEAFVRVQHRFVNPCRDHRLRAHFPLPARVGGSDAECAYAVVHRGLTAEGGPHEPALPTFPSRRFVDASDGSVGLGLVHDGLLEYEVVGDGTELALTLLRSVGWLSRREPDLRPNPAGPALAVPDAQLLGERTATYAVVLHPGDWRAGELPAVADRVLTPFVVAPVGPGFATRPAAGGGLAGLDPGGAEVTAVRPVADGVEVRLHVPGPEPVRAQVPSGSRRIDLRGAPADGRRAVEPDGGLALGPGEIATVVVPRAAVAAAWPPPDR
jgi:alpha-mannosidase